MLTVGNNAPILAICLRLVLARPAGGAAVAGGWCGRRRHLLATVTTVTAVWGADRIRPRPTGAGLSSSSPPLTVSVTEFVDRELITYP